MPLACLVGAQAAESWARRSASPDQFLPADWDGRAPAWPRSEILTVPSLNCSSLNFLITT